jgi:hypothetical protein
MTQSPSVAHQPKDEVSPAVRVHPPEERFWQRYSPRSELPISSLASISLHLVVLVLLLAGGLLLIRLPDTAKPLPGAAIEVGDGPEVGGGDNQGGEPEPTKPEAIGQAGSTDLPGVKDKDEKLKLPASRAEEPPPQFENPGHRDIEEAETAGQNLSRLADGIRDRLWERQRRPDGASGPGNDAKSGRSAGELASQRKPRMDRWVLNFPTRDGNDYAHQLQVLGAIVAIPRPDGQYLVIRDLKGRPARGKVEDIAAIQRIFWVDNKPDSVRSLAQALQLDRVPPWFAAFFPETLERELLRKELAFQGRREEDIRRTFFRLERKGTGYEPVVVGQEPRKGAN